MFCECGHELRTIEEIDNGQCVRCSSKKAPKQSPIDWVAAGKAAYNNGEGRAPILNDGVMQAIRGGCDVTAICRDFLDGWDNACLADG